MALRASWGSGPGVAASCWRSAASIRTSRRPPSFPTLERIAIALSSGNNPRLTCEAYFAITANTVQFGARAPLYAAAYGFSVEGDVGFDVLIQLAPLHFIADFHASVQLKRGSQQSVQGLGRRRARRAAAAARQRQGVVRDLLVRLLGALRQDADRRRAAAAAAGRSTCSRELRQALASPQSWSAQTRATRHTAWRCASSRRAARWCSIRSGRRGASSRGRAAQHRARHRDLRRRAGRRARGASVRRRLKGRRRTCSDAQDQFAPASSST